MPPHSPFAARPPPALHRLAGTRDPGRLVTIRGAVLGVATLVATHNPELAARMDRTVTLRDGRVVPL